MAIFPFRRRKKNIAAASQRTSLPAPLSKAIRESCWLSFSALAIYLILILFSYNTNDSGWSHISSSSETPANYGGIFGAWLADILLSTFGLSAWWIIVPCLISVKWTYRRIEQTLTSTKPVAIIASLGFLIIITASSSLEALRLHSIKAQLPLEPGGMLGALLGNSLSYLLGFTGATILLIFAFCIGISLFSGFSWIRLMEQVGSFVEFILVKLYYAFQALQDKKIGRKIENERAEKVLVEKKKLEKNSILLDPSLSDERFDEDPETEDETAEIAEQIVAPIEPSSASDTELATTATVDVTPTAADPPKSTSELPSLNLLDPAPLAEEDISIENLAATSRLIERKLKEFGVQVKVLDAYPGPVITRYEVEPSVGVKGSQIVNLMKDLARALGLISIRVVETIPGKTCMGLELPNVKREIVRLTEILNSDVYQMLASKIVLVLGKDISGKPVVTDLAKAPHILAAGTTGSGKSVAINAMVLSLLYKASPREVRLIMIDPKMLELSIYEGIPHLLAPVVTDMRLAANALNWCVAEMERRYKLMSAMGVRNLAGFNQKIHEAEKAETRITNPFSLTPDDPEPLSALPLIVIIIDELADLMMVAGKKIEELIARLAQKARAAGIHLILATQRPSVDVITGLIKANIPTRVAFQVSSKVDSRTILDQMGAEALLGQGDMLFLPPGTGYPQRVHGAFVADEEVHRVVEFLKTQGEPDYIEDILSAEPAENGSASVGDLMGVVGNMEADPLYDEAVAIVIKTRRASISAVQRQLRIGYNRAARLIEQMEKSGLISAMESNGNRTVLAPSPAE